MAKSRTRKRQLPDELHHESPAKKLKSTTASGNFPPSVWDNLSEVWLTSRALRELDRRNDLSLGPEPSPDQVISVDLARFARNGGPDLQPLRGYPDMSASSSSRSRNSGSTKATSRTRKSSTYDQNFQVLLADHNIYLAGHDHGKDTEAPEPEDLAECLSEMAASRASLSPSKATKYPEFKKKVAQASRETTVTGTVLPLLLGETEFKSGRDVLFTQLEPLTTDDTVRPKPDFFDGARLYDIDRSIREDGEVSSRIIPTKDPFTPVAPNFFLEAKGPDGSIAVARRQAGYDGAHGARAMMTLQSYGRAEPMYDRKTYAFTATLQDANLQIYAHHVEGPATPDGRPEYHMTKLRGFDLTNSADSFRAGTACLRNTRDMAGRRRDTVIELANSRAREGMHEHAFSPTVEDDLQIILSNPDHDAAVVERQPTNRHQKR